MDDNILDIDSNEEQIIKEPVKLQNKYLYNDYFQKTAKLWKEYDPKLKLFEKIDSGRIFLKNGTPSYYEIYKEPRLRIMGISEKISILYPPLEKDNHKYDEKNCIGFRYYEKSNEEKGNYFTLVKRYDNRFFVLEKGKEKEEQIFDVNGETFYEENLNCFSIMQNIVFEKYKNEIVCPRGEIFPAIIGFAYSLITLKKFKDFIPIEPLILEPLNEESKIEKLPDKLEPKIGYIEPIMFDDHISVAVIKKSDKKISGRVNIIFDMSRYHIDDNLLDNTVFPKELYYNHYSYPKFEIQKGNSYGLWFFGIVECIYSNKNYMNVNDVCLAINNNNTKFFIDVINCLSVKLYNVSDLIDNLHLVENPNVQKNRVYELGIVRSYSFKKEAVMNYYFSLVNLFPYYYETKKDFIDEEKIRLFYLLLEYQYLIDDIKNYLSQVIFNNNYFQAYSPLYKQEQKVEYQNLIYNLKVLLTKVKNNYERNFDICLYRQFEEQLKYGNMVDKEKIRVIYEDLKYSGIKKDKTDIDNINTLKKEFNAIKNRKKNVAIKEETSISKYLNPNNDFYFQMMIH